MLSDPALRLGGGSSKGFGSLGILEIKWGEFEPDRYSSSLNFSSDEFVKFMPDSAADGNSARQKFIRYELKISPDDFFMFGSGFGDKDADQTSVLESVIDYENKCLGKRKILIPASSVKGALSHRTAFYFNKINKQFGEKAKVGSENEAVRKIFGYEKNKNEKGSKGKILISDCFLDYDEAKDTKVFEHVSIDRFTGGAIDSALFQEKAVAKRDKFIIEILLKNDARDDTEKRAFKNVLEAFETALDDLVKGRLPLGGVTTKGYGFFKGEVIKTAIDRS
ncbi:RAMP superfamily CRISPR-associated protein [uncultured Campylobacter sp.]|uniref:RAMP superfamily CRISPR-associated protein n=1 Tax=uncultured Campylobacter sp. TaxID=218934 RepID=UPI002627CC45|nr:RAMP superfamily CRISPR-associated protein [uncultured Campylobacter sp.]